MKPNNALILLLCFSIATGCTNSNKPVERTKDEKHDFSSFVLNYQKQELPVKYGSKEPDYKKIKDKAIADSVYITSFIDPAFYNEPAEDRTYGYYYGDKVIENGHITGLVHLFAYNLGFQYLLYTYTPEGKIIDSLELAGSNGEEYIQEGQVNNDLSISLKRDYYKYDEEKDTSYVDSTVTYRYKINADGRIVKQ